jgi:hypothetical protein
MKLNGIYPPRRERWMPLTPDSCHPFGIATNMLDRNFKIEVLNTV